MTGDEVAERVASVRSRIAAAAVRVGRSPADVQLVAVTKTVAVPLMQAAVAAGITAVGENRVQEAAAKFEKLQPPARAMRSYDDMGHEIASLVKLGLPKNLANKMAGDRYRQLPDDLVDAGRAVVEWHLLGHLQRNKAAVAASLFDWIHSIDSATIAIAIGERRHEDLPPVRALIEVDFTGIDTRMGVRDIDLAALTRAIAHQGGINVIGLMTVAPPGGPDVSRSAFARLRALRDEIQQSTGTALPHLSMGMSDDFEVAIEEGATMVRIGRAIFGERSPLG